MATKIGDAFLQLRVDRAQAERDARTAAQGLGEIFVSVFSAIKVKDLFKDSIQSASNLNQTIAQSKTIFGTAQGDLEAFARSADKNFGLSERSALQASNAIGNLLTNLGFTGAESVAASKQLTQVAADLGTAFNKDTASVLDALTRGLAGQTRGLKQYGIVLDAVSLKTEAERLGLSNGTGALDAHARAAASLSLILQDTAKFSGDFAASTDTVATSQRIAKAEQENASASLGQNFLPIYQKITVVVGEAAKVFGSLPGPIQVGVVALGALVALSGPITVMVGVIEDLAIAIGALELSGGEILAIVGAVAAVAAGLALFGGKQDEVAKHSQDVAKSLDAQIQKTTETAQATAGATTAAEGFVEAQTAMSNAIVDADKHQQRLKEALGALGLQTGDAARLMLELQSADKLFIDSIKGSTPEIRNRAQAQLELIGMMLRQKGVSAEAAATIVAEAGSLANGKGGVVGFAEATRGLTAEQMALVTALLNVGKSASLIDVNQIATKYLNSKVAASQYNETLIEQAEDQAGTTRNSADAMKVLAAYKTIVDNLTPAQREQAKVTKDVGQEFADAGGAAEDSVQGISAWEISMDQAKQSAEANKDATSALKDSLKDATNEFDRAKNAADTFSKALDAVFNPTLDLEAANEKLNSGLQDITKTVEDAKKNNDALATSLDISTESGNKNREGIKSQVEAILGMAKANVENGASVDDVEASTALYRQQLENTLTQLGFNKDEVHAYIDQLGLTPEKVKTAVELDKAEETKKRLEDLLTQLGDISAPWAAKIQAEIDHGAFDKAEADLQFLARNRPVLFVPSGSFTSGDVAGGRRPGGTVNSAMGRFVPGGSNIITSVGEVPGSTGDEVILPLGDPRRSAEIMSDPRVHSRLMGTPASGPAVHIDNAIFNNGTDAEAVAQIVMFKTTYSGVS